MVERVLAWLVFSSLNFTRERERWLLMKMGLGEDRFQKEVHLTLVVQVPRIRFRHGFERSRGCEHGRFSFSTNSCVVPSRLMPPCHPLI